VVRRTSREDLLQVVDGTLRIARAVLRHGRRLVEQREPWALLGRAGNHLVVERKQLVPSSLDRELERDAVKSPSCPGIDVEHAVQQIRHTLRVVHPLVVEAHRSIDQVQRDITLQIGAQHRAVGSRNRPCSIELAGHPLDLIPQLRLRRRTHRLAYRLLQTRVDGNRCGLRGRNLHPLRHRFWRNRIALRRRYDRRGRLRGRPFLLLGWRTVVQRRYVERDLHYPSGLVGHPWLLQDHRPHLQRRVVLARFEGDLFEIVDLLHAVIRPFPIDFVVV